MARFFNATGFFWVPLCPASRKMDRGLLPGMLLVLVLILGMLLRTGHGFNVDTRTALVLSGDEGSMFGYTVEQHIERGKSWLLVGAPKASTSQPRVIQGGAVYKCKTDRPSCSQVQFDERGANIRYKNGSYVPEDDKSHQWFGATVSSSGVDGVVVACAPRYVFFTSNVERREPVGTCYVTQDGIGGSRFKEYSPCRNETLTKTSSPTDEWSTENQTTLHFIEGHCQAGLAAALNSDGSYLAIGAVGSYYWQGQVYSQDLNRDRNLYRTMEGSSIFDDTYMGYSAVAGDFDDDGRDDYAIGVPKDEDLKGKVVFFRDNLEDLSSIVGEQVGEYFGYSLTTGDFNGDRRADLAIGAPFYSDYISDAYENGRVYVYYQSYTQRFPSSWRTLLEGEKKVGSRFGSSLASLGDINNDGFDDLAVGAPYDGANSKGAIYIFHGSSQGILTKVSQTIFAEDVDPSLSTFGFSVSSGYDLDNNGYTDVLIGAYESNKAVYLKSRPIIEVKTTIEMDPPIIDLKEKGCDSDGVKVTCFSIETCVTYSGLKVPGDVELSLAWKLDSLKVHSPRVFFLDGKTTTKTSARRVRKNNKSCMVHLAFVKDNIRDKLTSITVNVEYDLVDDPVGPNELLPILDQYIPRLIRGQAHIQKKCGDDKICIPDLKIYAERITKEHVLGNTTAIDIDVSVMNIGEDSFETMLSIILPPGVSYVNVNRSALSSVAIKCEQKQDSTDGIVIATCEIGNPLPAFLQARFILRTTVASDADVSAPYLEYNFMTNSTNQENDTDMGDNEASVRVPIVAVTEIRVNGHSEPEQMLYNSSELVLDIERYSDVGPELAHIYEIRNSGPSPVETLTVLVNWPSSLPDGRDLLYLAVQPTIVDGAGYCVAETLNYRNLTVDGEDVDDVDGSDVSGATFAAMREQFSQLRSKRDTEVAEQQTQDSEVVKNVRCGARKFGCTPIRCTISNVTKDESVYVQVKSRVWINTIIELQDVHLGGITVESNAVVQVLDIPHGIKAREYSIETFQVQTSVAALYFRERPKLQLWIIAVACLGGCLLLLLLMLIMWKCGFFKRNKPEDMQRLHVEVIDGSAAKENSSLAYTTSYRDEAEQPRAGGTEGGGNQQKNRTQ